MTPLPNEAVFSRKPIPQKRKRRTRAVFFLVTASLLSLFLLAGAALYGFETYYETRVYPGITLADMPVKGLTRGELEKFLAAFKNDLETKGILFDYQNEKTALFPRATAAEDLDLTYELFAIDTDETVSSIWNIGREKTGIKNIITHGKLLLKPRDIAPQIALSHDAVKQALRDHFINLEKPARNAGLSVSDELKVILIPEERGVLPDYDQAIEELRKRLLDITTSAITVHAKEDKPTVTIADLAAKKTEVEELLSMKNGLTLRYQNREWIVDKNAYKAWITVSENSLAFTDGFIEYLKKTIAADVENPAQEARFQLTEDGRVVEFQPSQEGIKIMYEAVKERAAADFLNSKDSIPVEIITETILPAYTTESVNNLGIKEIIGTGTSRFNGSPKNRRYNIKIGADTLNGILIPPGEEFSLIKALGEIDGEHGYLPELVIKGNRTIPEYGGGLCQIGTTLFRGALSSGLPITERRAHSYRVRYYEPAGTDCTIYPPHPDCKFVNDTGNHILIQTRITEKDELVFEFWGTKDGRKVTQTEPLIYDIAKPPKTLYIETEDIPEGETKCTERAHDGAKTKFDYKVEYPNGEVKEQIFYSSYKPWQAVCLVGKKKTELETPSASSL